MSKHYVVERSVLVTRAPEEAFAYISDPGLTPHWRARVVRSQHLPVGPLRPGSIIIVDEFVLGRRITTESIVDAVVDDRRLAFSHLVGPIVVNTVYDCSPTPTGTLVTVRLGVELAGRWTAFADRLRADADRDLAVSLVRLQGALHQRPALV
jgi:hypothetical protein